MSENQQKKQSRMVYAITIMLSVLFIFWGNRLYAGDFRFFDEQRSARVVGATITRVIGEERGETEQIDVGSVESLQIAFEAKLTSGAQKGQTVTAYQQNGGYSPNYLRKVGEGDKVLISRIGDERSDWVMRDYVRIDGLVILGAAFLLILILLGRAKGVNTILSLALTFLAIFTVFIPAILSGHNIYLSTVVISVFIVCMSLMLVTGPGKKSLAAGIGCVCGLAVSGLLMPAMDALFKLTGVVDEESIYLLAINPEHPMDLKAVVFAAVLIGALGAALDISVSISSALHEMYAGREKPGFAAVMKSGMNVGRDIMGAMTNTLILAYIGGSLSLVLLLITYSNSLTELLSKEMVAVEVLHALVGSIGILFAIPATAAASAFLFDRRGIIRR